MVDVGPPAGQIAEEIIRLLGASADRRARPQLGRPATSDSMDAARFIEDDTDRPRNGPAEGMLMAAETNPERMAWRRRRRAPRPGANGGPM